MALAEYTVSLHDTISQQNGVHTVVKNTPFVVHIVPKGSNKGQPPPSVQSLRLIYSSSPVREVSLRSTSPIDFTAHKATTKDNIAFLAVEVRLYILSSQHEGENFKAVITLEGGQELLTEPLKCVSKQAKPIPPKSNKGSSGVHESNNSSDNSAPNTPPPPSSSPLPSISPQTQSSQQPPSRPHSHSHSHTHNHNHTHHTQTSTNTLPTTRSITKKRLRETENTEKVLKRIVSEQQTQRVLLELLFKQTQYIMAAIAPTLTPSSSPLTNPSPPFNTNITTHDNNHNNLQQVNCPHHVKIEEE
eukprot:TRINITY_DN6264_c0_g1_i2.p1 TRINITY_DN6264_c0_g1~~TRINITY_DN6264_c0_g1_i2.p1  ORF type:complete len:302 (-),score=68.70 TRINITY_DN6264_c0_g1_i2:290-1195(-)